ncbi:putative alpha/beta fold family hydrolase [Penicillium brasilianum]|uniref:Putative alpha/beta fold family hydrolase n=1 Tax=Penicillium brasilianum TaxID=104259 RepID=A0A1S9RMJ6_PENBI|nr:putative alpha/beta fold family hydrolase [Penicillium brasilianum]
MHLHEPFPEPPQQAESALLNRRRRRKSLPMRSQGPNSSTDPTSPEVISSLISSLSAISVPLNSHFDNVPRIDSKDSSDPGLPDVPQTAPCFTIPPSKQNGFGLSFGTYATAEEPPHNLLHPDDAASSPVIRMARAPPSPKTPKSPRSPRFKPFKTTDSSVRPESRDSYTSVRAAPEDSAFGTISAEPAPRPSKAPSIASNSSAGRTKSLKGHFGLLKKSSREFHNDKETQADRLRRTTSHNDSLRHNTSRSRASLRSMYSMADVAEEHGPSGLAENGLMEEPSKGLIASTPPTREQPSIQNTPDAHQNPGGIGSGRIIPTRDSSLRHRHSQSSGSKKRRSARHSRYSSTASRDSTLAENGLPGSSNDAEQVTKRIQELKDQQQRIKTELEADDGPGKSTGTAPVRPSKPSRSTSQVDQSRISKTQNGSAYGRSAMNDSAPSPSVMTGKSRMGKPGAPLSSKPTNFSPEMQRQSSEKLDHEKNRLRRSLEPISPTPSHRRTPSGPTLVNRASINTERPSSADSIDLAVDDYIFSPKLTQRVPHPTTGRTIAFSEVGDPKGHVVLCCLGMGLTRYLMAFYDELARTLNLRLVTLDRPGVGESGPHLLDEPSNPLSWPDDVAIVCNHLRVTKFSILAHSAGAIYALATALRIPQHIRGRIHLLAPWIPPSQLSSIGSQKEPVPTNAVPYSQRILRALPTSLLKVANTSFMSATSASITTSLPKSPRRAKKKTTKEASKEEVPALPVPASSVEPKSPQPGALSPVEPSKPSNVTHAAYRDSDATLGSRDKSPEEELERQRDYDTRLTHKVWALATANANPAVDLLTCLERRQTIGFRYVDITRATVIHHGSKDTRVPVENVQWLGKTMRRCEVRILEGEGHGLMASASVMGSVLTEIAKEWEDWTTIVQGRRRATAQQAARPSLSLQA